MSEQKMNIYQRKNAVMRAIRYLKKDGRIEFGNQKYNAVTHDAVVGALRGHLVEHGIDVGVTVTEHTLNGKATIADVDLILTNIDDPQDKITYHGFAYGENGDKGPGSAISYAVKTLLLKAFCIETGENDESRFDLETQDDETVQALAERAKKAIDEGDWPEVCACDQSEGWTEAWRLIDTRRKKVAKELIGKRDEYRDLLNDYAEKEDASGIEQLWTELQDSGKSAVWRVLGESAKAYIKKVREAA